MRMMQVDLGRNGPIVRRNRVRRDGDQRPGAVQPRLLEKAAAPPEARHLDRIARRGRDAVRGERQVHTSGEPGHHLVAALCAGREHRGSFELVRRLGKRSGESVRRERQDGVDPHRPRLSELACKREGLPRRVAVLHQDQHAHKTPAFCSISTTACAAAAPLPRDSARRP